MRTSPDFEDIVYVIDNRNEIAQEIAQADVLLRESIRSFLSQLSDDRNLNETLLAALPYGSGKAGVDRIRKIIQGILLDVL